MNPIYRIILFTVLISLSATTFAENGVVSGADLFNGFAVVIVHLFIKGGVGYGMFKLLTLGLDKYSIITAHQQGRWVAGWLVGGIIFIQSLKQLTEGKYLDFFALLILLILVAWIMGYVFGVLWFKFKNYKKTYSHNSNRIIDEKHWELAENEFNSERKTGLWAESYSDAKGDENLAKAIYLKKRATQFAAEESLTEPQIESLVMVVPHNEQVIGFDWLKEVSFCVLLFVIFMGLSSLSKH